MTRRWRPLRRDSIATPGGRNSQLARGPQVVPFSKAHLRAARVIPRRTSTEALDARRARAEEIDGAQQKKRFVQWWIPKILAHVSAMLRDEPQKLEMKSPGAPSLNEGAAGRHAPPEPLWDANDVGA